MSACDDLINAINAVVVHPGMKFFVDLSCAVLSNPPTNGTKQLVQLAAGGDAILSAPSSPNISGRLLRLTLAGNLHLEGDYLSSLDVALRFGTTTDGTQLWGVTLNGVYPQVTKNQPFLMSALCVWESVSQQFYMRAPAGTTVGTNNDALLTPTSVSAQTNLQFCVTGQYDGTTDPRSITVTQFSLEAE